MQLPETSRFTPLCDDEVEVEVVVPAVNTRSLISRYDRTSRLLHRGPRGRCLVCEGGN